MQLVRDTLTGILADLTVTGSIFDPAAVYLAPFTAITDRGLRTTLTDVDFGGFPLGPPNTPLVAFGGYFFSDGRAHTDGTTQFFPSDLGVLTMLVQGWAYVDGVVPTVLWGYQVLPQPLFVDSAVAYLTIYPRLVADPLARWGSCRVFSA